RAQALLELLERQREHACSGGFDVHHRHLEAPARLVQRQPAPTADRHPLLERELEPRCFAREQHAVELCLLVLEAEVEMSRSRTLEPGDLAFDPDVGEPALERETRSLEDLDDPVDPRSRRRLGRDYSRRRREPGLQRQLALDGVVGVGAGIRRGPPAHFPARAAARSKSAALARTTSRSWY